MGSLSRFDKKCISLKSFHKMYGFTTMIETGCFKGESIEHMLQYDFIKDVFSCDVELKFVEHCKSKFQKNSNVKIYNLDSHTFLHQILPLTQSEKSIMFWLDAHYYKSYIPNYNEIDYPLEKEIEIINHHRKDKEDIIIVDDVYSLVQNSEKYKQLHKIPKTGINFIKAYGYNVQLFDADKGYLLLTR
jgi:hypothetical protein